MAMGGNTECQQCVVMTMSNLFMPQTIYTYVTSNATEDDHVSSEFAPWTNSKSGSRKYTATILLHRPKNDVTFLGNGFLPKG